MTVLDARRQHRCTVCDKVAPWSRAWRWYGSYSQLDDGKPVVKTCSDGCRREAKRRGLVPRNAREADAA